MPEFGITVHTLTATAEGDLERDLQRRGDLWFAPGSDTPETVPPTHWRRIPPAA